MDYIQWSLRPTEPQLAATEEPFQIVCDLKIEFLKHIIFFLVQNSMCENWWRQIGKYFCSKLELF